MLKQQIISGEHVLNNKYNIKIKIKQQNYPNGRGGHRTTHPLASSLVDALQVGSLQVQIYSPVCHIRINFILN